jgi:hypothetical protein
LQLTDDGSNPLSALASGIETLALRCDESIQNYTAQPGVYDSKKFMQTFDDEDIKVTSTPNSIQTSFYDGIYCTSSALKQPCSAYKRSFTFPSSTPDGYRINRADFETSFQCDPGQTIGVVITDADDDIFVGSLTCEFFREDPTIRGFRVFTTHSLRKVTIATNFKEYTIKRIYYYSTTCDYTAEPSASPTTISGNMNKGRSMGMATNRTMGMGTRRG